MYEGKWDWLVASGLIAEYSLKIYKKLWCWGSSIIFFFKNIFVGSH
jgi:hypothetical protein